MRCDAGEIEYASASTYGEGTSGSESHEGSDWLEIGHGGSRLRNAGRRIVALVLSVSICGCELYSLCKRHSPLRCPGAQNTLKAQPPRMGGASGRPQSTMPVPSCLGTGLPLPCPRRPNHGGGLGRTRPPPSRLGLEGLNRGHPGVKSAYDKDFRSRVLALWEEAPPAGRACWDDLGCQPAPGSFSGLLACVFRPHRLCQVAVRPNAQLPVGQVRVTTAAGNSVMQ